MSTAAQETLVVAPTSNPRQVRSADGRLLIPPEGWALLPPGDAGLTRRVKAAGPTWTVVEKKGRKVFSRGVWAPAGHIETARAALEEERATPAYARKRAWRPRRGASASRPPTRWTSPTRCCASWPSRQDYQPTARALAVAVAAHATPVGSGTVARTERIPIERRAEAAVIAWMRHQTTAYDGMAIARVKGARREVRRELADISRALLDLHRRGAPHAVPGCPLCRAMEKLGAPREA